MLYKSYSRAFRKLLTCFGLLCKSLLNVFVPRAETATACLRQRTLLDYSEEERVVPNINF